MTPREATTLEKILKLSQDNWPIEPKKWSILVSENRISIHQPVNGGFLSIPRKEFDALIDWYQRDQKPEADEAV